jgi:fatty-acyl-CoA synthase
LNIASFLNRAETLWRNREAVVDGKKRLTYGELALRARRLATQLATVGLKKGDVISIIAPNCTEYIELYFACAMSGAILNPINNRLSPREIAFILKDAGAKTLVIHVEKCEHLQQIIARTGVLEEIVFIGGIPATKPSLLAFDYDTLMRLGGEFAMDSTEPSTMETAHLYYTSGTAGSPKGVQLTHANVYAHALGAIAELGLSESDTWLHAAPMFHLADAWAIFAITAVGGRHVVMPTFHAPDALSLIEREKVTTTNLIPTMIAAMLNDQSLKRHRYSSVRRIMSGGAPIAPGMVQRLMETFGCDYVQTYGLTESSPYLTLSLPTGDLSRLSQEEVFAIKCRTGRPIMGVELRVVRADGTDVEPNDEEVGEIIVRGATITPGYLNLPEVTAQTFKDGWFHTGDLAVVNQDRSVNIVDRKKDVILTGGETVYSIEVENAILEHPDVLEATVVGIPDDFWGETVRAMVVLKEGRFLEEEDLVNFVKSNIAHFKAPKSIIFVGELPKLGSGKIWKKGVKDWFLAEIKRMEAEQAVSSAVFQELTVPSEDTGASGEAVFEEGAAQPEQLVQETAFVEEKDDVTENEDQLEPAVTIHEDSEPSPSAATPVNEQT